MKNPLRRLVIHLGLPKTATKSLQAHVFPQLPGYLGWYDTYTFASSALDEFVKLYNIGVLVDGKRVFEIDGRPVWLAALNKWVNELITSDEEILLLSFEGFSAWPTEGNIAGWPMNDLPGNQPRRGSHPSIQFLHTLRALLPSHVELKTILTLRNQCDWLGSLAAQMRVSDISFIERLIREDDASLDYEALTSDLEQLRGQDNHLTLFFENGLDHNARKIIYFSGYSDAILKNFQLSRERENVRKSEAGWSVQGTSFADRLEPTLRIIRKKIPFLKRILSSKNLILKDLIRSAIKSLNSLSFMNASVKISISEKQKAFIKMHCRPSNERLSKRLNENLKALGYY